jgi:hypothetical protein
MKTNHVTKLSKTLLAFAFIVLLYGKATAQVDQTLEHQAPHATIPGECTSEGGESF